jgi:chromosome partitioning protein
VRVIAIANQKGGTGKTTLSINMAYYLTAIKKERTLLIDADIGQESSTTWASLNAGQYFDVVGIAPNAIKDFIERNQDAYENVIIDCPPRANKEQGRFVQVSHLVLIPIQPSPFDVWASMDLAEIIQTYRNLTAGTPGLPPTGLPHAYFVMSMGVRGSRIIGETAEAIVDTGFGHLQSMTTQYQVYKRSIAEGKTIFDASERQGLAEKQIIDITEESLRIIDNEDANTEN